MDFFQPLYEIAKDICRPIARHLGYAVSLPKKFTELNNRLKKLCRRRDDIKDELEHVSLQKAPTRECKGWIANVDEIEQQVNTIEEQRLVYKRCFKGWFPDVVARVKLGGRMVEMIERVKELQEESKFEGGFVTDLPLAKVEMMPVPANLGAEGSVTRTLQKILGHIRDKQIQKIGIWGMGGIGKTTLMKLLNNMPEIRSMFEVVIWVTVSKSWSIRKVQDEVAERLSLDIKNVSNERVARILLRELEGKKYLLLLDDVWEFMDLADVGIRSPNLNNSCKVVLTTREFRVCRRMGTDKEINVEALSKEEAWELFNSIVGDVGKFKTIEPIAQQVVQKCGGLPLALNVVGGALRKVEDVDVWRNLLNKLKSPSFSNMEEMSEYVFKSLKASFDQIKNSNTKNCFLYCGLYPEDHEIKKSKLIRYWRAEGLLSSTACTLAEAGVEGRALLHELIDASLMEKCNDDKHVKMHDVIHDLVLKMTSPEGEESRHVVRAGLSTMKIPEAKLEEWESAIRISFMDSCWDGTLPEKPNCPKLLTLMLQSHRESYYKVSETIPESFFNHMPSLRVLDLLDSAICSLPSSIANLVSLRALLLKGCYNLEALPREINALKKLEVLRVTKNRMRDLPNEIWELTNLKCLKFQSSYHRALKEVMIPSGKIFKLSQLEEFGISWNYFQLDEASTGVVVKELCSLTRLSSLIFDFRSVNNLIQFVENNKAWRDQSLTRFQFSVRKSPYFVDPGYKRVLFYWCGQGDEGSSIVSSAAVRDVIKRSHYLELVGVGQILGKLSDMGVENICELKHLSVSLCDALESVADEDGLRVGAFANLEVLILGGLSNLRSIFCWSSQVSSSLIQSKNNFTKLRELKVSRCPMLKQLFSSWDHIVDDDEKSNSNSQQQLDQYLSKLPELVNFFCWPLLQELQLVDCPKLETFPFGPHNLPQLQFLVLQNLPELVSFVNPKNENNNASFPTLELCWESLKIVGFISCPKLEIFPFSVDSAPNLKKIGSDGPLKWRDDATKSQFSPLVVDQTSFHWYLSTVLHLQRKLKGRA